MLASSDTGVPREGDVRLDHETSTLLRIVRQAAREHVLLGFRRLSPAQVHVKSGPEDLVTDADRGAEVAIERAVRAAFPDASVVGKEAVAADASLLERIDGPGTCVVVDPIDGTHNYASGLALFGMIVAVVEAGETRLGLLHDPIGDDAVVAVRGAGTWLIGASGGAERLHVRTPPARAKPSGYVPLHLMDPGRQRRAAGRLAGYGRTATLSCSCHEYRTLALGHADFCIGVRAWPWDHAAGVLAVREAGGVAVRSDGEPYQPGRHDGSVITAVSGEVLARVRDDFGLLRPEPSSIAETA